MLVVGKFTNNQEIEGYLLQYNRHMEVVRSALRPGRLYLCWYTWYLILLEADSTAGQYSCRKDYVN